MASIKQLDDRRFKITVSNGYRPDGKKICKAKTIRVPETHPQSEASRSMWLTRRTELERQFKSGYGEDGNMTFEEFAEHWLTRQVRYAPSTLESYRRMLERVYPFIGAIQLNRLRPIALENMLVELRKRKYRGKPIGEATVQKYLTVVSAVLSDAKRNEIIQKNPARMIDLPLTRRTTQYIPSPVEIQKLLDALAKGASALPDVLSALHVYRLPPGGAVRPQEGGFQVQQRRSAPDHQPLPQRCPWKRCRGRLY